MGMWVGSNNMWQMLSESIFTVSAISAVSAVSPCPYTPTVNSEWLPGCKFVVSCPGVLQQKIQIFFCCSTSGQDITNTYVYSGMSVF